MVTYSSFVVVAIYVFSTMFISYLVNKRHSKAGDFSTGGSSLAGLPRVFRYWQLTLVQ